jgi:hypothetical protein
MAVPRLTGHTPRVPQGATFGVPSGRIMRCAYCSKDFLYDGRLTAECDACRLAVVLTERDSARSAGQFVLAIALAEAALLIAGCLWAVAHLGG